LIILAFAAPAARAATPVGPEAVWETLMGVMGNLHDECGSKTVPDVTVCLPDFMRKAGASAQALAFTSRLKGEGFLRRFDAAGPVGVAFVHYPFRANANNGVLLVNGRPDIVDVSDPKLLRPLEKDPRIEAIRVEEPEAGLWATDPGGPTTLLRGAGRRFVFSFPLRTCHACENLAAARVAYDFDKDGKFLGVRLLSVAKPSDSSQNH
jgi:hypothetical protein